MIKYLAVRCILAGIIIGLAALASFWLALTFAIIWAIIAEIGVWCLSNELEQERLIHEDELTSYREEMAMLK